MSPRTPSEEFPSTTATLYSAAIAGNDQGLVQERLLLAAIVEEAQEAIFSQTLDGIVTTWNQAAERLFDFCAPEIVGKPSRLFVPPTALREEESLVKALCLGNLPAPFATVRLRKGGERLPVTLALSPIKNALGEIVGISTIARRLEEERAIVDGLSLSGAVRETNTKEMEEVNRHLHPPATTDSLTGLKNHRVFHEWLQREADQAERYDAPLSVLLLDVDRFTEYNSRFGYLAGDAALQKLAEVLQAAARTTELVARYGGEEFAILLPETDARSAKIIAERFRAAIETAAWTHGLITASFGIATFGLKTAGPTTLIKQAEEALSRSKERGRNCVTHAADRSGMIKEPALYAVVMQPLEELQTDSFASASEALRQSLMASYDVTVESWSRLLDRRDKETEGHNKRVTSLMVRLAHHVGMTEEEVLFAKWGAQLHDIGKIAVPDEILHKRGPLCVEEWVEIRRHPVIAHEMLSPIPFLGPAIDIAYCHHEKWDGTGYPRALKGTAIPFAARLFTVIDVYDALCSDRTYRDGWTENRVCEYLRRQAGTHFDPQAVEAFLEMLETNQTPPRPFRYAVVA